MPNIKQNQIKKKESTNAKKIGAEIKIVKREDKESDLNKLTIEILARQEKIKIEMWHIGRVLSKINKDSLYKQWNYKGFLEYCENELSYSRRTVYNFINLYENYDLQYVKETPFDNYKLLLVARYIDNQEEREKFLKSVPPKITCKELEKQLKKEKKADPYRDKDVDEIVIDNLKPNFNHIKKLMHEYSKNEINQDDEKEIINKIEHKLNNFYEDVKKIFKNYNF